MRQFENRREQIVEELLCLNIHALLFNYFLWRHEVERGQAVRLALHLQREEALHRADLVRAAEGAPRGHARAAGGLGGGRQREH